MSAPPVDLRSANIASIAAAIAAVSVAGIGLGLSIPLLAIELETRGIARTWIGINTAVGGIANIVAAPFMTGLVRRFGAGNMLLCAIGLAALSLIGFKASPWFALWFPLRFAFGVAMCALFVVSEFWINAAAPPARRGLVMGVYATILSLGVAGGPAILNLTGTVGWMPYLIGAALFVAGGIPVIMGASGAPEIHTDSRFGILDMLRLAPSATLAALIFGAVETGEMSFLAIYGLQRGLDEGSAALLMTITMLGGVAFQIPLGLLSDRMDRRRLLLICGTIGLAGMCLLPLLPMEGWTIRGVLFVSIGVVAGLYTVGLAHLGARFHGAELASANSAFVMLYSIGLTVGPPLVGAGMDAANPQGFAYTLATFLALYVAVVGWRVARVP
ncbi:MFS transporter [Bosea sp. 117]|uniref:MFS transporter n=1 Tax=Bosea sp. 117 TaxID=1125973 RepID=UPI000494C54F|nr:MFS transporter [Bosea sp. 117]